MLTALVPYRNVVRIELTRVDVNATLTLTYIQAHTWLQEKEALITTAGSISS